MSVTIRNIRTILTAPEGINLVVVKVETSEPELYGLGCATFAYRHLAVKSVVDDYLAPLLIGRNVADVTQLWQLMNYNAYWRGGPIQNNAISGVDMALWDIKAKMAGLPLYQLFGGKQREGVQIYRHAEGRNIEELCDRILAFQEQGVHNVRCQCGGYGGDGFAAAPLSAPKNSYPGVYLDPERYIPDTVALFDELRSRLGDNIGLCHDIHSRLQPMDAIRLARSLEHCHMLFLEDPFCSERIEWLQMWRKHTITPVAQGELFSHPAEWKKVIEGQLVDYIRIHPSQIGGITPALKVQNFASMYGVKTAWHGPGDMSPIGHAVNIHLDLSAENFGIQEWSGIHAPNFILHELNGSGKALLEVFPGMLRQEKGYVYPNEVPGLGVDIDEAAAAKFPCNTSVTVWTQTRSPDGSLQSP
ncbi:enolase C-terminal domain-like protein [Anaerotruncus rubiinfantis]|uniref:enolase C-terminal domain-like protein n=1 Tax=Anaerotruncus rubiinfantis TaxID=1720200 RepID=UPI000831808F|nr:enolase C-terminal domain-like protein [Anaerotruncus rubiinfantis]